MDIYCWNLKTNKFRLNGTETHFLKRSASVFIKRQKIRNMEINTHVWI